MKKSYTNLPWKIKRGDLFLFGTNQRSYPYSIGGNDLKEAFRSMKYHIARLNTDKVRQIIVHDGIRIASYVALTLWDEGVLTKDHLKKAEIGEDCIVVKHEIFGRLSIVPFSRLCFQDFEFTVEIHAACEPNKKFPARFQPGHGFCFQL